MSPQFIKGLSDSFRLSTYSLTVLSGQTLLDSPTHVLQGSGIWEAEKSSRAQNIQSQW